MQDNLSLYHIFYTVARTGSISHSSRDLYISQPAISKSIQKLEQNLDTVLFKRSSRGVTLTPDGELLFEKVKEALSLLDEGENSIRHNRSRDIPKLRLGASSTLTRYVLLSHLENYIARFPHVRITISCQSTYQTLQLLDEEKIDLGLIGRPQKLRGYYFQPLLKIQDTFVCTQQYLENQKKLYPDEPLIQAATFMMLDEDNITRQTVNTQLKEHHVELSHILEVTTMDLLIQFAEIGLGIACVIRDFVKKELEEGTLVEVPVGFSFPLREIGFVCRQKDADSALIAPFFDDETEHPDKYRNVKKFPSDHCDQMGILNFKKVSYHCITCVTFLTQTSLRFVRVAQNLFDLQ